MCIRDRYYTFKKDCCIDGIPCIISKTGYTGEDGVEIYMAGNDAPRLWELLLEAGREEGLIPCGLGARDTPVSYTHLDVYKRQARYWASPCRTSNVSRPTPMQRFGIWEIIPAEVRL